MGTSSSSLSTPITFTGQSTFSSSFEQVLQRAVSIASLPMQELENEVNTLQSQQTDLNNMQSAFNTLQGALQSVASAATGQVSASSSDNSVVVATAQSTTLPGTYSISVQNVGSSTSTISNAGSPPVTDPTTANISPSSTFTLTVNGNTTTITPTSGTLHSLADAINTSNSGVSATIVNLGSNSSPDYRLALNSTELGADTIQLNDGTNDLLNTVQTGTLAQYTVNGNTQNVLSSDSDQITLAPGLTANLVSANPNETVTITVAASEGNLSAALSNFVTAYNSAASAVASETGQNGGALAGESVVYELQKALSQIANYSTGTGVLHDLSDLGLTLSQSGSLSFSAAQFGSLSGSQIQQFLGSLTSGGFLEIANNTLTSAASPTSGMLLTQYTNTSAQITNEQNLISKDQTQVNQIQTNLAQQLSQADAAIAILQEQSSYYANLFQTENANHFAGLA